MVIMAGFMANVEQRILIRAVKPSPPRNAQALYCHQHNLWTYISTLLMSLTLPRNFRNWEGGKMIMK